MTKRFTELGIALAVLLALIAIFAGPAKGATPDAKEFSSTCPYENQEARITEQLSAEPDRAFYIIQGDELQRFEKNLRELYNIELNGDKAYVIEQAQKADNPAFQGVHLFVVLEGCITHYQTTYAKLVELLLLEDPLKALEGQNFAGPAEKPIIIDNVDPGGSIGTFAMWYSRLAEAGIKIVVDGQCISACAMIFGMIPQENVCVTENAAFGLHMATDMEGNTSNDVTEQMVRLFYPVFIRDLIKARGGLKAESLLWLYPEDLEGFYHACTDEELAEAGLTKNRVKADEARM